MKKNKKEVATVEFYEIGVHGRDRFAEVAFTLPREGGHYAFEFYLYTDDDGQTRISTKDDESLQYDLDDVFVEFSLTGQDVYGWILNEFNRAGYSINPNGKYGYYKLNSDYGDIPI